MTEHKHAELLRAIADEEDGEPDYYADGWNDAIYAMMAIRERK